MKKQILGTIYEYKNYEDCNNELWFFMPTKLYYSLEELQQEYPMAALKNIFEVSLLDRFHGKKNVVRSMPLDTEIGAGTDVAYQTESPAERESHLYLRLSSNLDGLEQLIKSRDEKKGVPYQGPKEKFEIAWHVGKSGGTVAQYFEKFMGLNEDCAQSLADSAFAERRKIDESLAERGQFFTIGDINSPAE